MLYKIVDCEYGMDICKSVKIRIGEGMKNPEILKLIPHHLKTKKMCKHAVKKSPFLIRYVTDQYKVQRCVIKLF